MPLASIDTMKNAGSVAEPFAHYSKRAFYPLAQAVSDWDEPDGELTLPPASTMVMIVVSSALGCLGLLLFLAWLGSTL